MHLGVPGFMGIFERIEGERRRKSGKSRTQMTRQRVNSIQQVDTFLGGFRIGWNRQPAKLRDRTVVGLACRMEGALCRLTRGSGSSGIKRAG